MDAVKIDKRFVAPLGAPKVDSFFRAIINLARTIDLRTVAEGCESVSQWQVIQSAGCEVVQGWIVAPAMDAEQPNVSWPTLRTGQGAGAAMDTAGRAVQS